MDQPQTIPTYEVRAMSYAEVLDLGFRMLRDHFVVLVGLAALLQVPQALIEAYAKTGAARGLLVSGLFTILVAGIFAPVVDAAIVFALGEAYVGRPVRIGESLRRMSGILGSLLTTGFLRGLLVAIGFLCLIVPGVILSVQYALVSPVMVVERTFGMSALRRSKSLMAGLGWQAVGIFAIAWLADMLMGYASTVVAHVPVVGAVTAGLFRAVAVAWTSATIVLLYFSIRCRKEGFDIEHLATIVEAQASRPTPAPAPA